MPPSQAPALSRIEPGSLERSYLWRKLEGTHKEIGGYGELIPVALKPDQTEKIRVWILEGAHR